MNKTEAIRVNVTLETRNALRELAGFHDTSEAQTIRTAIRQYLSETALICSRCGCKSWSSNAGDRCGNTEMGGSCGGTFLPSS